MKIVLASSSAYRKSLLSRLKKPFITYAPDIDESLDIKAHPEFVETLSVQKAQKAQILYPDAVCIGCDTIATMGEKRLGKPSNAQEAVEQLLSMSGQKIDFYSGVSVVYKPKSLILKSTIVTEVEFRELTIPMIEHYLELEKPYQSCGSFKSETLGIALIKKCKSDDPTALIGLPLITLCDMLQTVGLNIFEPTI